MSFSETSLPTRPGRHNAEIGHYGQTLITQVPILEINLYYVGFVWLTFDSCVNLQRKTSFSLPVKNITTEDQREITESYRVNYGKMEMLNIKFYVA